MTKSLTLSDVLGLGFMTFAFYLGAGNIIFPPLAGYMAGEHLSLAMLGFLVTAVGLPLITIIAVAKAGNGWAGMTKLLPAGVATALAVAIYIIIGPAFAAPRTGLVAYEMGLKPFLGDMGPSGLAAYTVLFFGVAILVSLNQGKLMDAIGKYLTPLLMLLLLTLAIGVFVAPQGTMPAATRRWVSAFSTTWRWRSNMRCSAITCSGWRWWTLTCTMATVPRTSWRGTSVR